MFSSSFQSFQLLEIFPERTWDLAPDVSRAAWLPDSLHFTIQKDPKSIKTIAIENGPLMIFPLKK
jgi:hypothetical protein